MLSLPALTAPLLAWYEKARRPLPWRTDRTPYHVWLSEIMLQQTRIEAVIPYYRRFLDACPTVEALAALPDDRLMKLWEGLGYYSRARNLKRAAILITEKHGKEFPRDIAALRALPGVGDYTAGAIASLAFGLPEPAVDGNVLRVLSRLTCDERNILLPAVKREYTAALAAIYPQEPQNATAMTEALMELGEVVCLPNGAPKCEECPLRPLCRAHAEGKAASLPNRAKRTARRIEERTVFLLLFEGRIGIFRRPPEGLLAGLWEFPSAAGRLDTEEATDILRGFGLSPLSIETGPSAKHIFTHREWHMTSYVVSLAGEGGGLRFVPEEELRTVYAIPSAFSAFLSFLTDNR